MVLPSPLCVASLMERLKDFTMGCSTENSKPFFRNQAYILWIPAALFPNISKQRLQEVSLMSFK